MHKKTEESAKKLLLPTFTLTKTCNEDLPGAIERKLPFNQAENKKYYFYFDSSNSSQYNLFPIVVAANGSPWAEANIYLLERIASTHAPTLSTYHSIADDLAAYLSFLEDEKLDFSEFSKNKLYRPTYRYRAHLIRTIQAEQIAPSTARRRMANVISFYRWLIAENILPTDIPPWQESDRYLNIKDNYGFGYIRKIKSTDVAIRVSKQNDPYAGTIADGGSLRPLPPLEQTWLLEALQSLQNTEMTLVHLVALTTGARIQTILTLRLKNVKKEILSSAHDVRILAGSGTEIDTKNSKRHAIILPRWVYERLRVYGVSQRARQRRCRAEGGDTDDQYLFLSIRGAPLYESKVDSHTFKPDKKIRYAKKGQGVRQFIRQYVVPYIRVTYNSPTFDYRFHDLRATFGMNLTDHQLSLVETGRTTLHQAREFVKHRMGHVSAATTDLYLRYRTDLATVRWAQDGYETRLKNLAEGDGN
jgi:integrase